LEASIKMAGKLASGRQSGHGINAGAGVRYQFARIGGPPSGLPGSRAGGWRAVSLRRLAGRGAIADTGAMRAG
jgi:hypothetical protein